jgi:hypothetical protein
MQLKLLNKKIFALLMLVILLSSTVTYIVLKNIYKNSKEVEQNETYEDRIMFKLEGKYWLDKTRIATPVFGKKPFDELTLKINDSLYNSFAKWIPETFDEAIITSIEVHEATDRYLSVGATYIISHIKVVKIMSADIYNTVDMQTGELVYLNDLFEVDEEFEQLLLTPGIAKREEYDEYFEYDEYSYSYFKPEEHSHGIVIGGRVYESRKGQLKGRLEKMSEPFDENSWEGKQTFYLRGDRIYFINIFTTFEVGVYVELDDLEEKLKVDKWW